MDNVDQEIFKQLEDCGFREVGQIYLRDEVLIPQINEELKWFGGVYAWVEHCKDGTPKRILYIGKAGKTLKERCDQHGQGFRRSTRGKIHAENILKLLSYEKTLNIWARKSETASIFGEEGSLKSVEEEALIKRFKPPWNYEWRGVRE